MEIGVPFELVGRVNVRVIIHNRAKISQSISKATAAAAAEIAKNVFSVIKGLLPSFWGNFGLPRRQPFPTMCDYYILVSMGQLTNLHPTSACKCQFVTYEYRVRADTS